MIYFMQDLDGGPVKIGYSADVGQRQIQLEAKYARPLTVLAVVPGDRKREREIHSQFAHLRFKRTEQFQPATELSDFIGRPLIVSANPAVIEAMEPQVETICVRCTHSFKKWLAGFAKSERVTPSQLVDQGLAYIAKMRGFELPPDR